MFDWIAAFFGGWLGVFVPGSVIKDALTRVVNTLISLFGPWVSAGANFASGFMWLVNRVWIFSGTVVHFGEYLMLVALPRAVADAFDRATAWAARELSALRDLVAGWVSTVETWVQQRFAQIITTVTGWVATIWNTLATLYNDFQIVKNTVVQLLTNPQVLADWIAGQIVGAVGRWFVRNASTIARYLLSRAIPGTELIADLVERLLVELFL